MPDLVLHHYDISPYAEKIRLVMGLKGLAWRSVHIPIVMPKPDLTALTGGYRLTPVLQIGADVYCDTRRIAAALEEVAPVPSLYPEGQAARTRGLAHWAETLFMDVITLFAEQGGVFDAAFVADRQRMLPGGFDPGAMGRLAPTRRDHVRAKLDILERQLAGSDPYLMGDVPSIADLAAYHPLWAGRLNPGVGALIARLPHVSAWMERVEALGHGQPCELDSGEAVEIAHASAPATQPAEDPDDPNGRVPGERVRIMPEAYGLCPSEGEWVCSDAHSLAIRRRDERAGEVVVHFPREGFLVLPAD